MNESLRVCSTFSPSRCLHDRKGSEVSQVHPVHQDHPALQDKPQVMEVRKGSRDPGVHKDHWDLQVQLESLGKMDSL